MCTPLDGAPVCAPWPANRPGAPLAAVGVVGALSGHLPVPLRAGVLFTPVP